MVEVLSQEEMNMLLKKVKGEDLSDSGPLIFIAAHTENGNYSIFPEKKELTKEIVENQNHDFRRVYDIELSGNYSDGAQIIVEKILQPSILTTDKSDFSKQTIVKGKLLAKIIQKRKEETRYLKIDTSTLTKEITYSDKETPFIEIERDEKNMISTVTVKSETLISVPLQKEPYEVIFEVNGDQGIVEVLKPALIQWKNSTTAHKKENGMIRLNMPRM